MITTEKQAEVQRFAERLFQEAPDWATFYREILGRHGVVRRMYPSLEALAAFEQTEAYEEIQRMLSQLRRRGPLAPSEEEPTRVITVRLPRCLHEALRAEAHDRHTSMNKLCISKLLQFIDKDMVPADLEVEET
jgi:predicted HicB family RNase H-like nuclease